MPNAAYGQHGVFIQCPSCHRWGNYSYVGTAEDRYDVLWRRVTCPSCYQETPISYDPFTTPPGEHIHVQCARCRSPFTVMFQPAQQGAFDPERELGIPPEEADR